MADERTSKARLAELSAALEAERELRRRAERALPVSEEAKRATQEFLTGLLEHAPTPIYATGIDGRSLLVNRAWEELWRLPARR